MQKAATLDFSGWDSITDVPCPSAECDGILRWAEAGYVPGYRICDGSKYHHHFVLKDKQLIEQRDRREEGCPIDRNAELRRMEAIAAENGRRRADESVGTDGIEVCAYWSGSGGRPCYGTKRGAQAYWDRLRELAPDAVAKIEQIQQTLPNSVELCNLMYDGTCMLYRKHVQGQLGGGTFIADVDSVLKATLHKDILADDYAALIGARRGYRVPKR